MSVNVCRKIGLSSGLVTALCGNELYGAYAKAPNDKKNFMALEPDLSNVASPTDTKDVIEVDNSFLEFVDREEKPFKTELFCGFKNDAPHAESLFFFGVNSKSNKLARRSDTGEIFVYERKPDCSEEGPDCFPEALDSAWANLRKICPELDETTYEIAVAASRIMELPPGELYYKIISNGQIKRAEMIKNGSKKELKIFWAPYKWHWTDIKGIQYLQNVDNFRYEKLPILPDRTVIVEKLKVFLPVEQDGLSLKPIALRKKGRNVRRSEDLGLDSVTKFVSDYFPLPLDWMSTSFGISWQSILGSNRNGQWI